MNLERIRGHNINPKEERMARQSVERNIGALEDVVGEDMVRELLEKAKNDRLSEEEINFLRSHKDEVEAALEKHHN